MLNFQLDKQEIAELRAAHRDAKNVGEAFSGLRDRDFGGCSGGARGFLELTRAAFSKQCWFEVVAIQQLVELGSIALGQTRCLGDVALRNLHDTHQIIAFKPTLRLCQR